MPLFDMPLPQLRTYRPERAEPSDFDDFWSRTLAEARQHELDPEFRPVDHLLTTVDVFDVRFSGWNGERIAAWLLLPRHRDEPLPAVVEYIGYGSGRSLPHQRLVMSAAGGGGVLSPHSATAPRGAPARPGTSSCCHR